MPRSLTCSARISGLNIAADQQRLLDEGWEAKLLNSMRKHVLVAIQKAYRECGKNGYIQQDILVLLLVSSPIFIAFGHS